jgi:hypothetical protein
MAPPGIQNENINTQNRGYYQNQGKSQASHMDLAQDVLQGKIGPQNFMP